MLVLHLHWVPSHAAFECQSHGHHGTNCKSYPNHLVPLTWSGVEHCMLGNLACLERNLEHDSVWVPRICRDMAMFGYISSICSDNKTIFAALNPSFCRWGSGCIRQSHMDKTWGERHKSTELFSASCLASTSTKLTERLEHCGFHRRTARGWQWMLRWTYRPRRDWEHQQCPRHSRRRSREAASTQE